SICRPASLWKNQAKCHSEAARNRSSDLINPAIVLRWPSDNKIHKCIKIPKPSCMLISNSNSSTCRLIARLTSSGWNALPCLHSAASQRDPPTCFFRAKIFEKGKCIDYTAITNQPLLSDVAVWWCHTQVEIDKIRFATVDDIRSLRRDFLNPFFPLTHDTNPRNERCGTSRSVLGRARIGNTQGGIYLRCGTQAEGIAAAQAIKLTYFQSKPGRSRTGHSVHHSSSNRVVSDGPIPMDISIGSIALYREERARPIFFSQRGLAPEWGLVFSQAELGFSSKLSFPSRL
ncbi:hypothetical protein GN958_ATG03627, partial [Phytophthora infestans]